MERYTRAYRDPKSPLTPLTPLSSNPAFKFDFGGDKSLDGVMSQIKFTPPHSKLNGKPSSRRSKNYSENFAKLRQMFEKQRKSPSACTIETANTTATRITAQSGKSKEEPPSKPKTSFLELPFQACIHSLNKAGKQENYRRSSPIAPKPISPRMEKILSKSNLSQLKPLFQREEIDLEVFSMLSEKELQNLGIMSANHKAELVQAMKWACQMLKSN